MLRACLLFSCYEGDSALRCWDRQSWPLQQSCGPWELGSSLACGGGKRGSAAFLSSLAPVGPDGGPCVGSLQAVICLFTHCCFPGIWTPARPTHVGHSVNVSRTNKASCTSPSFHSRRTERSRQEWLQWRKWKEKIPLFMADNLLRGSTGLQ